MKYKNKKLNSAAVALGRKGGQETAKRGKRYMTKLAKMAAKARWEPEKNQTIKS